MTTQECIDALNSINWDLSPGEIYNEFRKIAFFYDYNILYPILRDLRTYDGARDFISHRLLIHGIHAVKRCLEHLPLDYNTDLFRVSEEGYLEPVTIPYLREVWVNLLDQVMCKAEIDKLLSNDEKASEPDEQEVIWVEEDDDFLTARKV